MPRLWIKLKKHLLVIAGSIALALGIIGIFVPVLPTTPFLLLAAFCYVRGSRRLYNALLQNRYVGSYLHNYLEKKAMSPGMKIRTLCLLWIALILTGIFVTDSLVFRITLGVVAAGVTAHILMIKTAR